MRSSRMRSYVCALVILVYITVLTSTLSDSQTTQPSPILSEAIPSFEVDHLCLLDALLQLGQEAGVPLGIEYVDPEAVEKTFTAKWGETTVGEIVEGLLGDREGYSWRVRDGVLTVSHESVVRGRENLLDQVLPEFSIPRCLVGDASNLLYMVLYQKLHPENQGFAGDYNPGDLQNLIGPFKLRDAPVWRVLNHLVCANKKAAWIVQVPPGHLDELPSSGLWTIDEYQTPPRRYAETLRHAIWGSNPKPPGRK